MDILTEQQAIEAVRQFPRKPLFITYYTGEYLNSPVAMRAFISGDLPDYSFCFGEVGEDIITTQNRNRALCDRLREAWADSHESSVRDVIIGSPKMQRQLKAFWEMRGEFLPPMYGLDDIGRAATRMGLHPLCAWLEGLASLKQWQAVENWFLEHQNEIPDWRGSDIEETE